MIEDAIKHIIELNEPRIVEVDDKKFATRKLTRAGEPDPQPSPIGLHSLSGLVDYISANIDQLKRAEIVIVVGDHKTVELQSRLIGFFQQRFSYASCQAFGCDYRFGNYYGLEEFNIALQSMFVPDDTTTALLRLIGNIKDESVTNFSDDGVTQQITAKVGVTQVENVAVPNPVTLRPYRTFREVEQPASEFVFRMRKQDKGMPLCALIEADGGKWKLEAIEKVKKWLGKKIKDVAIIA